MSLPIPNCTEIPSESRSNRIKQGPGLPDLWQAQRGWLVQGATDDESARNATPIFGSDPIAQMDESHPLNSILTCTQLPVERDEGGYTNIVRAVYSMDPGITVDPLNAPPIITPEWSTTSEPLDQDAVLKIAVTNTAGDPFESELSYEYDDLTITIQRNEPFYPLAKAIQFKNTCNLGSYTIPNVGPISDGQALCKPIKVASGYTPNPLYVTCIYTLRLRADGWKTRIKSQGYNGWYKDSTSGNRMMAQIVDGRGQPRSTPALLDINGMPVETSFMIDSGFNGATGVSPVAAPSSRLLPNSVLDVPTSGNGAVFVRFDRYNKISFAGLLS